MRRAPGLLLLLAVCTVGAASLGIGSAVAATGTQKITLYGALAKKTFINNSDDRTRGQGANPFGNYSGALTPTPSNERLFGPFPGDTAEVAFGLFANASHTTRKGSAIFICQYNFDENAFCNASFQLADGALIAKGPVSFNSQKSTLVVVGGTGKYRGLKGDVDVTALGVATQAQPVSRAVPLLQAQQFAFVVRPVSVAAPKRVTVYSSAAEQAFVNNDDDSARGNLNNPFGAHNSRAGAKSAPFPGDMALFTFNVYMTADLKKKAGTAAITCYYYYDQNAFCDASFQLNGGTVIAAGAFSFNATKFALAVTGGYGRYDQASGDLEATPSGKLAQRLSFVLG